MNNVTQLRPNIPAGNAVSHAYDLPSGTDLLLHDLASPIMFKAYERGLWYEGRTGAKFSNTGHKALVRMIDDKPFCLNVVRETYKVVQNDELFSMIHEGLVSGLGRDPLKTATIKDKTAYGGAICFREYIFPEISVESPERDKIAFRVVIQNGFGTGAIKMLAGAIDFYCTNGLVIGEYTRTYAKHTKGLQITRFKEAVEGSVHMFWRNKDFYSSLAGKKVLNNDLVCEFYHKHFGERLGDRLFHQYLVEAKTRGHNLWAVYSALTYYSSHSVGEFGLRNTGNDHAAATMMKRENDVRKVVADQRAFMELAA